MQPPPSNNSSSSGINNKSRGSISTSSRRRALRLLTTTAATLTIASLVGRTDAFLPPIPSSTSIRLHATPTSTSSSSPATAAPPKPAHGHGGGGHGGMMGGPIDPNSFVQTELRKEAMRLHTREQAPREGEAKEEGVEQSPFQQWAPTRQDYLQFLVDSKLVRPYPP
ncbi:heme oxygenase 1, partial [Nannochloropsis oceanica]